jgi:hypothetical protein
MTAIEIHRLIQAGAQLKVRQYLKKLSLKDRIPLLHECMPWVAETPANLKFFRDNFAQEFGALSAAAFDYVRAEEIYNGAKLLK